MNESRHLSPATPAAIGLGAGIAAASDPAGFVHRLRQHRGEAGA